MRRFVLLVAVLTLLGCDSTPATPDAGPGADAGTDSGMVAPTPFQYGIRVVGIAAAGAGDRAPIEGVRVLVDTDVGRVEGLTGADGMATVDATTNDGLFDVLVLGEGRLVLSIPGRTIDSITAEPEEHLLTPFPFVPDLVEVSVSVTGVPPGGWCLASGQWRLNCQARGTITDFVPQVAFTGRFSAIAIGADGVVADVVEGELTGDPLTASITFDDTSELTLATRTVEIALPTNPESPYSDPSTLPLTWNGWIAAVAPDTLLMRGVATNVQPTAPGTGLTMDFTTATDADETLIYALGIYPRSARLGTRTFRWFSTPPTESPLTFMDAPRPLSEGMPLDSLITWTPVAGADSYSVQVEVNEQVGLRVLTSGTEARLPVLPDDFDDSAIFPPGEEWAILRPVAIQGTVPPGPNPDARYNVDGQLARGLPFSLAR